MYKLLKTVTATVAPLIQHEILVRAAVELVLLARVRINILPITAVRPQKKPDKRLTIKSNDLICI